MSRWPEKPLLELAKLTRGTEPGSRSYTDPALGRRFLRVGDITGKRDNPVFTSADNLVVVSDTDLLIALDGTPGHIGIGHSGAICSGIRKVEVLSGGKVSLGWLRYVLASPTVQATIKRHTRGATIPHASSAVSHIRVPVPPWEEQGQIVKLLDEGDELRKLRAQADCRTATLVSALFHQMFSDPVHKGSRWPKVPLGEMGAIVTGNTPSRKKPEYFGNFIEWVKTDNIDALHGIVTKAAEGLSEKGLSVGRVVPAGAVLVKCIAGSRESIGDAAITDRRVAINQQINAIVVSSANNPTFICELICRLKGLIQHNVTGVMTGIINKSTLALMPAICPPLSLQKEFAIRVSGIRTLQAEQAASRKRLDDLFQSMLHRAFQAEL